MNDHRGRDTRGVSDCGVEIVAHRGASSDAPENTLAAVRMAWDQAADAVEIDIHLSADGYAVVIHDDTLKRTAGIDASVADRTLRELQSCDVGRWKGPEWAGETIPSLGQVIETIPTGRRLFAEIKSGPQTIEAISRDLALVADRPEAVVLLCFDVDVLAAAQRRFPQHSLLFGVEQKQSNDGDWQPGLDQIIDTAILHAATGVDLSWTPAIDARAVSQLKQAGLLTAVWTVNDPSEAHRVRDAEIQCITTDCPAVIRRAMLPGEHRASAR
jgi:glycerophosphoryl diester phosphodiesterase